jgi:hypothetical protein
VSLHPKGKRLTLVCGHTLDWPRLVTDAGHVWCVVCDGKRKIKSVH